jgi:prevent-host-death family protein
MDSVTVAELKAKLSHYLREVRSGRSFTVVSHGIPVAVLGPHEATEAVELEVIAPDPGAPALSAPVLGHPPAGLPDAVQLLRTWRDQDRDRLAGDLPAPPEGPPKHP